jgi:hypothetical protein
MILLFVGLIVGLLALIALLALWLISLGDIFQRTVLLNLDDRRIGKK